MPAVKGLIALNTSTKNHYRLMEGIDLQSGLIVVGHQDFDALTRYRSLFAIKFSFVAPVPQNWPPVEAG